MELWSCLLDIAASWFADIDEGAPVNHCADCCCAKAWEALGITEYTGRSIPEEIALLRAK